MWISVLMFVDNVDKFVNTLINKSRIVNKYVDCLLFVDRKYRKDAKIRIL